MMAIDPHETADFARELVQTAQEESIRGLLGATLAEIKRVAASGRSSYFFIRAADRFKGNKFWEADPEGFLLVQALARRGFKVHDEGLDLLFKAADSPQFQSYRLVIDWEHE